ncbi:DeoR family transcriptional regulator [Tessaracoccus coleopterorum]|uniref:DeoR family transcriptional regulator n=1 Tax=Tessaracoccus coleopterorum TaxID=2714950 RepID=UPI001E5D8DB0|nr:DeoR family transcriptional regulator [Tessaracoccus coleopterorum]
MTVEREQRELQIMDRLNVDGALTVSGLAAELGVSEVTIRGDLRALEEQGMLLRTRAGPARPPGSPSSRASRSTSTPSSASPRWPPR